LSQLYRQCFLQESLSLLYFISQVDPNICWRAGFQDMDLGAPHNDRRSYKALRERDISMPAPLQSELPSRGLRCPWIGQQRTSRENEQRETREVVLRQSSVRKTGLQLPINALKHIPTRHQHSQVERHRGAGGQYEPEPPLENHTPTATVMR
jgi:hypothetical protein